MMWKQFLATLASIIAAVTIGVGLAVVPRMDTLALPSPAASKAAPEEIPPATLPRQDEAAPSEEASLPPSGYLLGEYNAHFASDLGAPVEATGEGYYRLRPASSRPYASLYAS